MTIKHETVRVLSPYNNQLIKELPLADAQDIESAITLAHEHFIDRKKWLKPHERISILQRTIDIMKKRIP
jgi:acyl-CoA reductase-like NAD-dependent aldehyde dehydrogenase